MTTSPEIGMRIIGSDEAGGIAMAKQREGTLASNNLHDIHPYVEKYETSHITTGDILMEAMNAGIITEASTPFEYNSKMLYASDNEFLRVFGELP